MSSSSNPKPGASVHSRFIPREELGRFASWTPGSFGGEPRRPPVSAPAAAPAPPPPPPSEADWLQRIDEARRAGAQEGYQNGYRDGLVALESFKQSFAAQTTAQVGLLLKAMQSEFDALQPRLADSVARVAVELARQVLRHELSTHPAVVSGVAQQALNALMHNARHIQLQVHPQDVALVREGAAELIEARRAQVLPNPALARGDCLIESDLGTLDARLASRWAQATANLVAAPAWGEEPLETPASIEKRAGDRAAGPTPGDNPAEGADRDPEAAR
jgi:flagellar assembly protein FliH